MLDYVWLILLFPLARGADQRPAGPLAEPAASWPLIASLAVGASFVVAVLVFVEMLGLPAGERQPAATAGSGSSPSFPGSCPATFEVEARILLDQLSILMALVVTGVSTLIHVYSAGYMKGEEYHNRYFTWLNLFVFMMLILVLGDNFLTMYVGWEGVGLCSYLLIGYWFEKRVGGGRGQEGVHRQPRRRLWLCPGHHADLCHLWQPGLRGRVPRCRDASCPARRRPSPCCSSWGPPASRPRSRSTSGCPTPWKARRRSAP